MQNREIKFRVWDKINKKFFSQDVLNKLPLDIFLASENIQQYTGLKDKNNKEIYEGDIVALPLESFHNKRRFIQEVPSIVELFNRKYNESIKDFYSDLEIIGNIFENKDLLD